MAEEIDNLKKQLAQKEEMLNGVHLILTSVISFLNCCPKSRILIVMKAKTKDFITKLKEEHAEQVLAMEQRQKELLQVSNNLISFGSRLHHV